MNTYISQIKQGDYIKHWVFDEFKMERYHCEKEADDVDFDTLKNYHTMEDVGKIKYTVRRSYSKIIAERMEKIELPEIAMKNLYYHVESNAVELSSFFHNATILSGAAKTFVDSDKEQSLKFNLKCSCYLKIWVNGEVVGVYYPKTRNVEQEYTISIPVKQGTNELAIYMEDLAERDIFFYFELRYEGEDVITYHVPIDGKQGEIERYAQILRSLHTESYSLEKGIVKVYYDNTLLKDEMEIYRSYTHYGLNDSLSKDQNFRLTPDKNYFEMEVTQPGEYFCLFTAYSGSVELKLYLFINIYDKAAHDIKPADTLQARKEQAIEYIAQNTIDTVGSAMAQLHYHGHMTQEVKEIMNSLLPRVADKKDCADFVLLPTFAMYMQYGHLLDEEMKAYIRELALDFRYWFDEPGNDVMWFYSENHALLFHGCQYLAGHLFEEDTFKVSGLTGKQQKEIGKARLNKWLDEYLERGYDEWNSVTYLPIDFIGLFSLYLAAPDAEIKEKITRAIDSTFEIIAANFYKYKYTAAYARVYESNIKGAETNETNLFAWIAFGQGMVTKFVNSSGLFSVSDYEPPTLSHILNGTHEKPVTVQRKEGCFAAHTYVHKTDDYSLATAVNFKPFTPGMQQHVLNIALGETATVIGINHPGEKAFSGERRPSYWAGNGTLPYVFQHKNTALAVYNIESNHAVDFIHAVMPFSTLDEYEMRDQWFFARKDEGLVAIWWSNGYEKTTYGANTNKEVISYGRHHGLYIKCESMKDYRNFEHFIEKITETSISYDGQRSLCVKDHEYGEIQIDCTASYLLNGEKKQVTPDERIVIG